MFDEVPNRRVTERRSNLKESVLAFLGIVGGVSEAIRKGGPDWETLGWAIVFVVGIYNYWRKRHEDPFTPPIEPSEPRT
jgi:hypothetical protein